MSKLFLMFLCDVGILVVGFLSAFLLKDITILVLCGFLFCIFAYELNEELVMIETYLEEKELEGDKYYE